MKAVLPESMADEGAQAMLANAYHLFLQPGDDILDAAGGLGKFMNWPGPTFTDSGGFQVMSQGSGLGKVIDMSTVEEPLGDDDVAKGQERMANVDDDGVWFRSYINGDLHRFTPEISMQIQHNLGADIMFAFDELTTLHNSRGYQEEALERTRLWALRCIAEHQRLTEDRSHKPYQALFGVIQGAQYEDLRRKACRDLSTMGFDGFGIGGAWKNSSWEQLFAGAPKSYRKVRRNIFWAYRSPMISLRQSTMAWTPSIVFHPPGWRDRRPSTPRPDDLT